MTKTIAKHHKLLTGPSPRGRGSGRRAQCRVPQIAHPKGPTLPRGPTGPQQRTAGPGPARIWTSACANCRPVTRAQ
jgi:hypothetical protein